MYHLYKHFSGCSKPEVDVKEVAEESVELEHDNVRKIQRTDLYPFRFETPNKVIDVVGKKNVNEMVKWLEDGNLDFIFLKSYMDDASLFSFNGVGIGDSISDAADILQNHFEELTNGIADNVVSKMMNGEINYNSDIITLVTSEMEGHLFVDKENPDYFLAIQDQESDGKISVLKYFYNGRVTQDGKMVVNTGEKIDLFPLRDHGISAIYKELGWQNNERKMQYQGMSFCEEGELLEIVIDYGEDNDFLYKFSGVEIGTPLEIVDDLLVDNFLLKSSREDFDVYIDEKYPDFILYMYKDNKAHTVDRIVYRYNNLEEYPPYNDYETSKTAQIVAEEQKIMDQGEEDYPFSTGTYYSIGGYYSYMIAEICDVGRFYQIQITDYDIGHIEKVVDGLIKKKPNGLYIIENTIDDSKNIYIREDEYGIIIEGLSSGYYCHFSIPHEKLNIASEEELLGTTEDTDSYDNSQPEEPWEDTTSDFQSKRYILPYSSELHLLEMDLWDLTKEEVRLGLNEIYARHGRKFKDEQLQKYFDSLEWYEGTVEPEDFSEDVLNQIEKDNIAYLKHYLEREYP